MSASITLSATTNQSTDSTESKMGRSISSKPSKLNVSSPLLTGSSLGFGIETEAGVPRISRQIRRLDTYKLPSPPTPNFPPIPPRPPNALPPENPPPANPPPPPRPSPPNTQKALPPPPCSLTPTELLQRWTTALTRARTCLPTAHTAFHSLLARMHGSDASVLRAQLWTNIGLLHAAAGEHRLAKRAFARAWMHNRADPLALYCLGGMEYWLGEYGMARESFGQCGWWMRAAQGEWGERRGETEVYDDWDYGGGMVLRGEDVRFGIEACDNAEELVAEGWEVDEEGVRGVVDGWLFGVPDLSHVRYGPWLVEGESQIEIEVEAEDGVSLEGGFENDLIAEYCRQGPAETEQYEIPVRPQSPARRAFRASSIYSRPTTYADLGHPLSGLTKLSIPPFSLARSARLTPLRSQPPPPVPPKVPQSAASSCSSRSDTSFAERRWQAIECGDVGESVTWDVLEEIEDEMRLEAALKLRPVLTHSDTASSNETVTTVFPSATFFNSKAVKRRLNPFRHGELSSASVVEPATLGGPANESTGQMVPPLVIGRPYESMSVSSPSTTSESPSSPKQRRLLPLALQALTHSASKGDRSSIKTFPMKSRTRLQKVRRSLTTRTRPDEVPMASPARNKLPRFLTYNLIKSLREEDVAARQT